MKQQPSGRPLANCGRSRGSKVIFESEMRAVHETEPLAATRFMSDDLTPSEAQAPLGRPNSSDLPPLPETHITPKSGWPSLDLGELWKCRDLIGQLTLRNIRVRYKQTVLGVLWAIIQPVLTMAVFLYVIPRNAGPLPNSVFVLAGLVPWFFFQTAVSTAANSVIGSEGLVTKVYFPRLAIPLASVAAGLVDLVVSFVVLAALMTWYGILPALGVVLLPLAVVLLTLAAVGIGTLIAALTVSYRDFRHAVAFLLPVWMLATPAIYLNRDVPAPTATANETAAVAGSENQRPLTDVRGSLNAGNGTRVGWLARLNPLTVPIEFFRAATLGTTVGAGGVLISFVVNGVICLLGLYYFRHVEDSFADVI
jgi:lipopolysaccharide transport system permease protein